jgi:hypothetical protein
MTENDEIEIMLLNFVLNHFSLYSLYVNLSLLYSWVISGAVKCICEWRSSTSYAIINYFTTWATREIDSQQKKYKRTNNDLLNSNTKSSSPSLSLSWLTSFNS